MEMKRVKATKRKKRKHKQINCQPKIKYGNKERKKEKGMKQLIIDLYKEGRKEERKKE